MSAELTAWAANAGKDLAENISFFRNQTANATSDEFPIYHSGIWILGASGTFDGATVKLQSKDAGEDDWQDITGGSFSSAGRVEVRIGFVEKVRAVISGVGGSTSIDFYLSYADSV